MPTIRPGSTPQAPTPLAPTPTLIGDQETRSVFALWQLPIGERLLTSLGGRVDGPITEDTPREAREASSFGCGFRRVGESPPCGSTDASTVASTAKPRRST